MVRFPFIRTFSKFGTCRLIRAEIFPISFQFCWREDRFCSWWEKRNCYAELTSKSATQVATTSPRFRERPVPHVLQQNYQAVAASVERKSTAVWRKQCHECYYYLITSYPCSAAWIEANLNPADFSGCSLLILQTAGFCTNMHLIALFKLKEMFSTTTHLSLW